MADLITVRLTFDELTALMNALAVAQDEANKAVHRAEVQNERAYPPMPCTIRRAWLEATHETRRTVTELYDRISDIWAENRPDAIRDARAR